MQHQRVDARRPAGRVAHGDASTLRHPDERDRIQLEVVEQRIEIVQFLIETGRTGGLAEAAPVERDHLEAPFQRRDLRRPHPPVHRPAVNQDHGTPASGDFGNEIALPRPPDHVKTRLALRCATQRSALPRAVAYDTRNAYRFHSRALAMRAPSAIDANFMYVMSGSTGPKPANVLKPQS